ncbi:MAG: hypothetical protein NT013_12070 [Planctomycetia bacterium]|nr:hypothetical protein [Planctomycetia bacterium]
MPAIVNSDCWSQAADSCGGQFAGHVSSRPHRWRVVSVILAVVLLAVLTPTEIFAADRPAEVEAAIQRGLNYLKGRTLQDYEAGLVTYAAISAGEKPDSEFVQKNVAIILKRFNSNSYAPQQHHIYGAAVDAMGLTAANRELYLPQIQLIADFIIKDQRENGAWDYANQNHGGDTSISQYGSLGLWAAARAGVKIPPKVWDRSVNWHALTHLQEGAFGYHPLGDEKGASHSMTVAAIGSLCIARIFLTDPSQTSVDLTETEEPAKPKKKDTKAFGVLEKVTPTENIPMDDATKTDRPENYKVTNTRRKMDAHIGGAMGWLGKHFTVDRPVGWPIYYLYGLERAAALTNSDKIGGRDWYKDGYSHLIKTQAADGSWFEQSGPTPATCFGILFLTRATEKIAPNTPPPPGKKAPKTLGEGMLQGGRGLPTDLTNIDTKNGQIKAKVMDTPLDRLLADLENPKSQNVEATQAALVESIQVGNREALLGQKELLLKLAKDSRSEVRRTAFWAIGRCNDLRVVPLLLKGLLDADFDASVEARNALCMLSRRPRGFGLLDDALEKIPESATPDERDAIIEKWRREDAGRWKDWYQKVRPYDERDNLPD